MQPLLQVQNLQLAFAATKVVDDVSFGIHRGETVSLVGESGSGKSMTALAIMRVLPTSANILNGAITFCGKDLLKLPEWAMRGVRGGDIGMIFQEPMASLNPVIRIGDQVAEALRRRAALSAGVAR